LLVLRDTAPDAVLDGDPSPFPTFILSKVLDSLRLTTKVDQGILWGSVSDDLRSVLIKKVQESLEVLVFYPDKRETSSGKVYDFLQLLRGLIRRQWPKKREQLQLKVIHSARRWLFYAWPVLRWTRNSILNSDEMKFWNDLKVSFKSNKKELDQLKKEVIEDILPGTCFLFLIECHILIM